MSSPAGGRIFPRWLVVLFGALAVGLLLYALRGVLTPVFFAFLIAYMLDPVVDRFEARNMPRSVGIAVMLTLVLGALAAFVVLAVPAIAREASTFLADLPAVFVRLRARVEPALLEYGIEIPTSLEQAMEQFDIGRDQLAHAAAPATAALKWLLGETATLMGALASLIIIPVFAAYLLHDFDRITAGIRDLVPPVWRPYVVDVAREVDSVLGEFIRGQLIVMLILAVLYATAYSLLGVRLAILIGIVAGLLSFIPYVGGAVALGLAVLMCLLDWQGWGQLIGVAVAYSVIQVLEGFVITPRVVGEKVGLPAVWVLFALMVGGDLFGFMGVLLALPAAAVIKIFVSRGVDWYRSSSLYEHGRWSPDEGFFSGVLRAEGLPDDEQTRAEKAGLGASARPPQTPREPVEAPHPVKADSAGD